MTFGSWLHGSNEAKLFRDALELVSQVPMEHGMRQEYFSMVQRKVEDAWENVKTEMGL